MSLPAHMVVKGRRQKEIKGSCDMEGREGTIFVRHAEHSMHNQEGKRHHGSLVITKDMDMSSPKLNQALITGESLSVVLKWYRINPAGKEEHYYTHELKDAIVKSIDLNMEIERVAFAYKKITWRWEPDGIEAEDQWQTPDL